MVSVDTNIIIRIVTADEPEQVRRAVVLFERERIFIAKTVPLEVEGVLRFSYRLSRDNIASVLRKFLGLGNVILENQDQVCDALDWYEAGLDFADALHLASSGRAARFVTFDRKMVNDARKLTPMEVSAV